MASLVEISERVDLMGERPMKDVSTTEETVKKEEDAQVRIERCLIPCKKTSLNAWLNVLHLYSNLLVENTAELKLCQKTVYCQKKEQIIRDFYIHSQPQVIVLAIQLWLITLQQLLFISAQSLQVQLNKKIWIFQVLLWVITQANLIWVPI